MIVLMLEQVSASLRGELTRWLLEPRPGVFVGKVSALVRDKLWEYVQKRAPNSAGMLAHPTQTEQGFAIRVYGETKRQAVDMEGITLIRHSSQHPRLKRGKSVR